MGCAPFWWGFVVWLAVVLAVNWQLPEVDYFTLMGGAMERFPGNIFETWWSLLADIVMFGVIASWMLQRAHDRGRSGWWWVAARGLGWFASVAAIYRLVESQSLQAVTQTVMDGAQTPPTETLPAILWGFGELWARNPDVIVLLVIGFVCLLIEVFGFVLALWPSEANVNAYGLPSGQAEQAEAFT